MPRRVCGGGKGEKGERKLAAGRRIPARPPRWANSGRTIPGVAWCHQVPRRECGGGGKGKREKESWLPDGGYRRASRGGPIRAEQAQGYLAPSRAPPRMRRRGKGEKGERKRQPTARIPARHRAVYRCLPVVKQPAGVGRGKGRKKKGRRPDDGFIAFCGIARSCLLSRPGISIAARSMSLPSDSHVPGSFPVRQPMDSQ